MRVRLLAAALLAALLAMPPAPVAATALAIGVRGNHLVDGGGLPLRLIGVNRAGGEYACIQGWGVFEGPPDAAMAAWHVNSVRLALNEDCWLGINGVPQQYSGGPYRDSVRAYAARLHAAGLYVVLELHWNAPGDAPATGSRAMADADHAVDFWRSVATAFRDDHAVLFDLYNEPYPPSWKCWRDGCPVSEDGATWRSAGMRQLVQAVRSTGARQPLLLGGMRGATDLRGWLANAPPDPAHALVAAVHAYPDQRCTDRACWDAELVPVARQVPLVAAEVGDCGQGLAARFMDWADAGGISYLAWTWNVWGGGCANGSSLISAWDGTPTSFGAVFRGHLARLVGADGSLPPPRPLPAPRTRAGGLLGWLLDLLRR